MSSIRVRLSTTMMGSGAIEAHPSSIAHIPLEHVHLSRIANRNTHARTHARTHACMQAHTHINLSPLIFTASASRLLSRTYSASTLGLYILSALIAPPSLSLQALRMPLALAGPQVRLVESLAPMWREECDRQAAAAAALTGGGGSRGDDASGNLPPRPRSPPRLPLRPLCPAVDAVHTEFEVGVWLRVHVFCIVGVHVCCCL